MKCRNCGSELDNDSIFCDKCEKKLKSAASQNDINELERLIEEQNKLNELEDTKELDNLSDLIKEEISTDEKLENTVTVEDSVIKNETDTREKKFEHNIEPEIEETVSKNNNRKKKKIIIIILIVVFVLILMSIIILLSINKNKKVEEIKIDYKTVINEYGKSIEVKVKRYIELNKEAPSWQNIGELVAYNKYNVVCSTHNIYMDGKIFLKDCKVNNKKTKYTYGSEQKEEKTGKKLSIYKISSNGYSSYYDNNVSGSSLIGSITCKTEECKYVIAFDKYVVVNEEGSYYLYQYENDTLEFGPFYMNSDYSINLIVNNNKLYGILYNESGINNIYITNSGNTIKNVLGSLVQDGPNFEASIMYKYGYVVMINNDKTNFVNLKTGNISYSIPEIIISFKEDIQSKIVYIITSTTDNKFKIYNSNGKSLFDGKSFEKYIIENNNIIVADKTNFKVYDNKLNLKTSSKNYDSILGIYSDFIVVLDNNHLELVNLEDEILTTFKEEWNDNYYFNKVNSGWNTYQGKYGIYLEFNNKQNSGSTKFYYIPSTEETGFIE